MVTKIIQVTHTDLDGIGCEFLANQLADYILEDPAKHEVYNCTYEDIDNKLYAIMTLIEANGEKDTTLLLITDIAPSDPDVVARLAEFAGASRYNAADPGVVLLDHHITARATFDKYLWYKFGNCICGTELLYRYMRDVWGFMDRPLPSYNSTAGIVHLRLENFACMVNDYDCWIKKQAPHCDNLNALFQLLGREDFITRCQMSSNPANLTAEEQRLVDVFAKKTHRDAMRALENGIKLGFGKDAVGHVVFSSSNQSMIGQLARDTGVDADFVAIIDPVGCKVSLRSIKDGFHVGEFAKARHASGGGHEKAAGYTLNREAMADIMREIIL